MSNKNVSSANESPLGWLRTLVFVASLAMMMVIIAWPHTFGATTASMQHNAAMLSMLGMSFGFIYGIGFVPRNKWLKILFSAPVALGLMVVGIAISQF